MPAEKGNCYDEKELHRIFLKKITDGGWNFSEDVGLGINWFKKNMDYFKCKMQVYNFDNNAKHLLI